MKKLKVLLCLVLVITLSACGKKDNKKLEISFDSNSSTGYSWNYSIDNSDIIDISSEYVDNCKEDVVGCQGKTVYTITPKKEGKVTIFFTYSRPWEKDSQVYNATYTITINKKLKIKESHTGSYFEK